jgi:DNA mismatch repair protein MutS
VEYFYKHQEINEQLSVDMHKIGDLERIISKVAMNRINPREVLQLKYALEAIVPIKQLCEDSGEPTLMHYAEQLNPCYSICNRIKKEINDEAPGQVQRGNVISPKVNSELDELRYIQFSGKDYLNQIQRRESESTGIPSLKVHFNNVFGYYIEVRNTHKDKVPSNWIRKQTLVNGERYITEELKEFESKILGAEEKILELETRLYNELVIEIAGFIPVIQLNAILVANLDCLQSFANVAVKNKYIRPLVNDTDVINIRNGRHPVIESQLPINELYVANDVSLDCDDQQIIILTGPNMSGKSALLRQTALIVLLAQIGSFVPADCAEIGYVDKIFTRVGASDNISLGESTFMVEMHETASILNNLSHRSLILLDEIGRGTSTYDGISIAWAMVEHIHEHSSAKAKTLFATHYHELNDMENTFKRIKNYHISIKELDKRVIFLRKLVRGGSEHSFGIHVARMAGMPRSVVQRAEEILKEMEASQKSEIPSRPAVDIGNKREGYQLSFYQLEDPVLKQIRDQIKHMDINRLTPIEALNKLNEIKKITGI